ncbi:MAG: trypsin-like serine protease [Proteobacteria bacterium]|nr:MAG: trypsin-like serine protease [Pseudomonadota bacterium]
MRGLFPVKRACTFVSTLALASQLACRSTNSTLDVVGGTLVRSTDPIAAHTVALVETEGTLDEYCTGVLIAPNAILTAAHCFLETKKHPMIYFGNSIPKLRSKTNNRFVEFGEVIIHPDFSQKRLQDYDKKIRKLSDAAKIPLPKEGLDDLAIVLFQDPHLSDFSPVAMAKDLPGDEPTHAAGFGCQSTECETYSSKLRKVALTFVKPLGETDMLVLSAGENRGTCTGDSGGPDFVTTSDGLKLLSIISTGPESCEAGISIETRVSPYFEWIKSVTNQ